MAIAAVTTDEPTVLAVGESLAAGAREALPVDHTVTAVPDATTAADRVGDREGDAVVLATPDAVRAVRAADGDVPIVAAPDPGADPDPAAFTNAGADRYAPRTDDGAADLPSFIAELVDAYDRRRQRRREGSAFRSWLESAPHSVYVKDADARVLAASANFTSSVTGSPLGLTDPEIHGDRIGRDTARETYQDDRAVIEEGEPILDKPEVHTLHGGETLHLRTDKVPWRRDGEVVGLIGLTRDVTERAERRRALEEQTRRLERFASYASHDLRSPLTVAKGHLARAIEGVDLTEARQAMEAIDHMDDLVEDLLDVVVVEEADAEERWTDLAATAEAAWDAIDPAEATLVVPVPHDCQVRAREGSLRRLLETLLSNAVEHGGPGVRVEVTRAETGFAVSDDGPGIPEADRERVFEPGYGAGGTGVGLSIADEIAEAHGWSIRADDSVDGGARILVSDCLRRRADRAPPAVGDPVDLEGPREVGETTAEAAAECADGAWVLRGAGRAVWEDIEEYVAATAAIEGDCRIQARLEDIDAVHEYSKAGLVIVDAVAPDRPLAFVGGTADHGHETAWRRVPGDPIETRGRVDSPVEGAHYRLDREGDRVTAYRSPDGEDWTMVDQAVLDLGAAVSVGLLVNSHAQGTPAEARFEDVRAVPLVFPTD